MKNEPIQPVEKIKAYLELADLYLNSSVFDKSILDSALKDYTIARNEAIQRLPLLVLYYPLKGLSNIRTCRTILQSEEFSQDDLEKIQILTNGVWYALNCRKDVRNALSESNSSIYVEDETALTRIMETLEIDQDPDTYFNLDGLEEISESIECDIIPMLLQDKGNGAETGQGKRPARTIPHPPKIERPDGNGKPEISRLFLAYSLKPQKVFLVHGRDLEMETEVKAYLELLRFKVIVLRYQPNKGKTIIEKLESYTDVDFGVVLYSPCDEGRLAGDERMMKRARQNVVFEHGYLIGKLGRDKVTMIMKDETIERPSDIQGLSYILMSENWKEQLWKELHQ